MKTIKNIFEFYISGSFHVAVSGFFLTQLTFLFLGNKNNELSLFVGLSIIVSYNFIRFFDRKNPRVLWYSNWLKKNRKQLSLLIFITTLWLLYLAIQQISRRTFWFLLPFGFITIFYTIPFSFGKRKITFRKIPSFKILGIALVWMSITFFLPVVETSTPLSLGVVLKGVQYFLFLIAILIPFDIRDVLVDQNSIQTLPQRMGIKNTKIVALVCLFLFVMIQVFYFNSNSWVSVVLIALFTGVLVIKSSVERGRMFTAFWVESIPILWYLLEVLLNERYIHI